MARIFPGSIFSSIQRKFTDIFSARANTTGGLGASTSGAIWNVVNGVINVVSGAATTITTPNSGSPGSSYPISTVAMPTFDNVIKLDGTNEGSAIALWVQSSSDWWMVNIEGTQITNTNYAGSTYWSYNYAYQYTNVAYGNLYSYASQYTQGNSYTGTTPTNTYYSTTGATQYYVTTVSATPYSAVAPYSTQNIYYAFVTPYTSKAGNPTYTRLSPSYYISASGAISYTSGASTYTSGKDITGYTASYTSGNPTYSIIPPGTYSSAVPYSYVQQYVYSYSIGAPYSQYNVSGYAYTFAGYTTSFTTQFSTGATYYTYASGSTTTYSEYLKLKRSVSNTVSELSSTLISNTQTVKSLLVSILGNQITAKAYSDLGLVTQVGPDLVYTATGATVTTQYGIGVSPSAYNQSAIIGTSIEISRN